MKFFVFQSHSKHCLQPMEEFLKLHGLQHVEISDANETRGAHILETNNLPVEVDWVKSGAVTPVKHQVLLNIV